MANATPMRIVYWVVLAVLIVAGLVGLVQRLTMGHEVINHGSLIPWGLWIVLYTYLGGLAAGLYVFSALGSVFEIEVFKPLRRVTAVGSLIALAAGLLLVWFDLGHMERFPELFFRPSSTSLMGRMSWVYAGFFVIVVVQLVLDYGGNATAAKWLGAVALVLAVAFAGTEGALMGVLGSRPAWNTGLFPIRFLVAGLVTAGAALTFILAFLWKAEGRDEMLRWVTGITLGLLIFEALMEFAAIETMLYGGAPAVKDALNLAMYGPDSWLFWGLQVLVGMVIPLVALVFFRGNRVIVGLGSVALMIGFVAARSNLLIPVLSVPELEGITEAYYSPRLSTVYVPSLTEWLVAVGVIALGLAVYSFLWDRLALNQPEGA